MGSFPLGKALFDTHTQQKYAECAPQPAGIHPRRQQGSGIGLFLTREIIDRHCGTIKVISGGKKKPKGSLFQIQLPVAGS